MLKNIIKVVFSNLLITVLGIINSFAFPVLMSINEYANYQKFMLYVSYISICQLGIASGMFINYGGMTYKKIDKKKYKSEILLILVVVSFFTIIGGLLYLFLSHWIVLVVSLLICPFCIVGSYKSLYQAWDMFTEYSIINAIPNLFITVFGLLLYYYTSEISSSYLIVTYVLIHYVVFAFIILIFIRDTIHIKSDPLFSKENIKTAKTGFLITLGNYINLLLHALDKQFVVLFFTSYSFAMYSFAMSTQNIMTIFITALAQPFYPKLSRGDFDQYDIKRLKEILFSFGSLSGSAYFTIAFVIKNFIPKYMDSLVIIAIFFAVFPAMAVINVLYINLYKVTKQIKHYILTLFGVLTCAILLNILSILLFNNNNGIALATMLSYYIWLLYAQRHFEMLFISLKDILFLLCFFAIYFIVVLKLNSIIGFITYTVTITVVNLIFYRKSLMYVIKIIKRKIR